MESVHLFKKKKQAQWYYMHSLNLKVMHRKLQKLDGYFINSNIRYCRSQWRRGLKGRSAAARLLRLRVRTPPGAWMYLSLVSVVCCQVERGLWDELITRPEDSLPTVMRRCV
jgi:hypothetical protein